MMWRREDEERENMSYPYKQWVFLWVSQHTEKLKKQSHRPTFCAQWRLAGCCSAGVGWRVIAVFFLFSLHFKLCFLFFVFSFSFSLSIFSLLFDASKTTPRTLLLRMSNLLLWKFLEEVDSSCMNSIHTLLQSNWEPSSNDIWVGVQSCTLLLTDLTWGQVINHYTSFEIIIA